MKKKIFITLLALLFPFTAAEAMIGDEDWSYFFHLQYKDGVLALEEGVKYPYDPIPVYFDGPTDKATAESMDFHGIIVSGKGARLAYFGFNKPETYSPTLGKSVFIAKGPFYANAARVDFYQKGGKKLFTVSVSGSSFCNDDKKCNSIVGENYRNCPNDCPPPPGGIPPREVVPPPQAVTPAVSPVTPVPTTAREEGNIILPGTTATDNTGTYIPEAGTPTRTIVFIVTGILALLLAGILYYMRRGME